MPRRGENIYKRKDGRWEGRYKIGCDASGKTKYRSVYGKTYQYVKDRLTALKAEPQQYGASGKLSVKALFSEWMTAIRHTVKASTYANYSMKIEKHILPAFCHMRYENLNADILQRFISGKLNDGLSAKYVADIVIVFKTMAKYMTRVHGFHNPIANVILPKVQKHEKKLYSDSQQKQLSHYLFTHPDRTAIGCLLSMYTGLRIGEVCGLKWSDIDFERHTLTVRRTVQRIRCERGQTATGLLIDTPKSHNSQRVIPMPDFLVKMLKRFAESKECYVLSGTMQPTEPRTMQNRFRAVLKKADLPSINYHSLRHIFATNCLHAGFDVKTLSEILGHASVETTLSRYVHSSMDRKIACMNLLSSKAYLPSETWSGDMGNTA